MVEHGDGLFVRIPARRVLGRERQIPNRPLVLRALFEMQRNFRRHFRRHRCAQSLEPLRQPAVEGDALGGVQPPVEHLAIQRVPELVLGGRHAVRQFAGGRPLDELLPFGQRAAHALRDPAKRVVASIVAIDQVVKCWPATLAHLRIRCSASLECRSWISSICLRVSGTPGFDLLQRHAERPAAVRLREHALLHEVVEHRRHEQRIAVGLAMNERWQVPVAGRRAPTPAAR